MGNIKVIKPGMYTTVQDLGRTEFQAFGVPVAGSMDHMAHRMANLLVGNNHDMPILEMTIMGGTFEFETDAVIALTGASMTPVLNESQAIGMWRTVKVSAGDILQFGNLQNGCRAYMAVAGGIEVPQVLGSASTYVRGNLGGYEGRILKAGDRIQFATVKDTSGLEGRFISADKIPRYESEIDLRLVLGPQEDAFTRKGIADFFSAAYRVSGEFDRMGYRLEGTSVEREQSADIISDGIVRGAVQIPGHGQPIIMLADCQTTGGYTKIGHVITSDLWKIAQAKTGDKVRFVPIDVEAAQDIYMDSMKQLEEVEEIFQRLYIKKDRDFKLNFLKKVFSVKVNEIEKR